MSQTNDNSDDLATAMEEHSATDEGVPETMEVNGSSSPKSETLDNEVGVDTGINRLLDRHRREIVFELRRLQHGERPVTGQGNREAVADLFARSTAPAPPEEVRPENVVVEVNALVERRPVSSILQSAQFRRSLENALRGAVSRTSPPIGGATRQPPPQASPRQSLLEGIRQRRGHVRGLSQASSTASSYVTVDSEGTQAPDGRVRPPPAPPLVGVAATGPEGVVDTREARAEAWVRREIPAQPDGRPPQELHAWDNLEQSHHEDFVQEVTELVQRQLVTSALDGDFRGRMENHLQRRLEAAGGDGRRVREYLRDIPRRQFIPRNDFSDLGIPTAHAESLADDISVISATAAVTVPMAQSQMAYSREVGSLKAQMQELRNMMRISFDLQLDIQRAIRQEVAAAMSTALAGQTAAPPQPATTSGVSSRPASESQCLICLDHSVDSVLYQCGHMCVCLACGLQLRTRGAHCPVCRAPIKDIIRAYRTNADES